MGWPREDARRSELIAARPAMANDVAAWARAVHDGHDGGHGHGGQSEVKQKSTKSTFAEISANGALALLAVACSLLDRQIATLEKNFVEEGGFTGRLYRVRTQRRNRA
jgi:four helix bundle suffix protein